MIELPRNVGVFGGVISGKDKIDLIEGNLVFAFADEGVDFDGFVVEEIEGEAVHAVMGAGGIEQIGGDHGIEGNALEFDAGVFEDDKVVFDILADFFDGGVGENGFKVIEDIAEVEAGLSKRGFDRNVIGMMRLP